MTDSGNCPMCGTPVVGGDEGTQHYEPIAAALPSHNCPADCECQPDCTLCPPKALGDGGDGALQEAALRVVGFVPTATFECDEVGRMTHTYQYTLALNNLRAALASHKLPNTPMCPWCNGTGVKEQICHLCLNTGEAWVIGCEGEDDSSVPWLRIRGGVRDDDSWRGRVCSYGHPNVQKPSIPCPNGCGHKLHDAPETCPTCGCERDNRAIKAVTVGLGCNAPFHAEPSARCHAGRDGDCVWSECPQLRDGEPVATGRHCPLDVHAEPSAEPVEGVS